MRHELVAYQVALGQPAWELFVRELRLAIPEGTQLNQLRVSRTGSDWSGSAQGEVVPEDPVLGLLLADDLRARLGSSSLFRVPQVAPRLDNGRVHFEIKFQLPQRRSLG